MVTIASKAKLYQRWLAKKFSEIEEEFYIHVDDLEHNLGQMDDPRVDDAQFTLESFSFIDQWETGLIPTAQVVNIFEKMDLRGAARNKVTKRLTNYMHKHDFLSELIKPIVANLSGDCVEMMIEYLAMLKKFFNYLHAVDSCQMKLTWVQQIYNKDGAIKVNYEEMTLNQTVRYVETFIDKAADQRFHLSDQVIVFDEEVGVDDRAVHWIFAPRSYIELLRLLFNVKETLGEDEIVFLKYLIKEKVQ